MTLLKRYGLIALSSSLLFANANAQETIGRSGASAGTIGGIATTTIVAGAVGVPVAAAVISNNRTSTIVPAPEEPQSQPGLIKVGAITGKVTLLNPATGETFEASADQQFTAPVTVITNGDSTILLLLSNGSSIQVQPGSRIEINEFSQQPYDSALGSFLGLAADPSLSQTNIKVVSGEIAVDVKPLSNGSVFRVETPTNGANLRNGIAVISYNPQSAESNIANISADISYTDAQGQTSNLPVGQTLAVSGQVDPATGNVSAGESSVVPNSSDAESKGAGIEQAVSNQQQGGQPATPTTPPAGNNATPEMDIPDLINPTSTEPNSIPSYPYPV